MKSPAFNAAVIILGFCLFATGQAYAQDAGQGLQVQYAGGTAETHIVNNQNGAKFSVSQPYSWVRDEASRYNLVSYSIDEGPSVDIPRKSRGNFLLELPAGTASTVTFRSAVQYPLSGSVDNANLLLIFAPPSPTGDNWFDAGTEISVTVSNRDHDTGVRQIITGWSIDNSKRMIEGASLTFTTPVIQVAAPHQMKFTSITQYQLDIVSSYGVATGAGWYDAGTTASISVQNDDDLLVPHNFVGWQDYSGEILDGNYQSIVVDSPITLTAKWETSYARLVGFIVLPTTIIITVVFLKQSRSKKRSPSETIPAIDHFDNQLRSSMHLVSGQGTTTEASHSQSVDNSYSQELAAYSMQKSVEKLQALQSSGLVSNTKFSKIKDKLEDVLE